MAEIIPFRSAIQQSDGKARSLLVGNGFSSKYFSYKTLLDKCGLDPDNPLRALFARLNTFDFEAVIKALEDSASVERAYSREKRALFLEAESDKLRRVLMHAIRQIHPAFRADIEAGFPPCIEFLSRFEKIFTVNYDLLLYWVILEEKDLFQDGFGLGEGGNGFRGPFKEQAYCNVYNLHGGLHLFCKSDDEVEKRIAGDEGIIAALDETITQHRRLPIFIAEGASNAKMARIYEVPYLRHCYRTLCESSGAFFVYGHSAGANDAHIYEALFNSEIEHLYFCVHQPTTKIEDVAGELARYKNKFASSVDYTFVDSESAGVWD